MAKRFKLKLVGDKQVVLRDMCVGDQELAAEAANLGDGVAAIVAAMKTQTELVKLLLEEVDGKKLTPVEREGIHKTFSVPQWSQIIKFIGTLNSTAGEPVVEVLTE